MMDYGDVFIRVYKVTCNRLSCPYMLLECDCTCDKMMMCVSCFGRPISLYFIHEECEWEPLTW